MILGTRAKWVIPVCLFYYFHVREFTKYDRSNYQNGTENSGERGMEVVTFLAKKFPASYGTRIF